MLHTQAGQTDTCVATVKYSLHSTNFFGRVRRKKKKKKRLSIYFIYVRFLSLLHLCFFFLQNVRMSSEHSARDRNSFFSGIINKVILVCSVRTASYDSSVVFPLPCFHGPRSLTCCTAERANDASKRRANPLSESLPKTDQPNCSPLENI